MPVPLLAILGAAALAGGGQALQVIPELIPSKADKLNKKKIAELEALQAGQGFGLTGQEKRLMNQQLTQPTLQALQEYNLPSVGSGDLNSQYAKQLAYNQALAMTKGNVQSQAQAQIYGVDQAKEAAQEQELENRIAYQSDRSKAKQEAALSIPANMTDAWLSAQTMGMLTGGAGGAAGAAGGNYNQLQGMPGGVPLETPPGAAPTFDPAAVGGTDAYAQYSQEYANDPEMMAYLQWLQGTAA